MTSAINPNNINGSYPVANQDNNSQGFRDNFTNIKVNFQDAAAEITDLQNKVLLKEPLIGSDVALTTSNDMGGTAPIIGALIRNFGANRIAVGATSGAISIDYVSGHYQSIVTSGNISLSFTNFPASGTYGYIKLQINITNTAHTLTLPSVVSLGLAGLQGINPGVAGAPNTITFGNTGIFEFAFGTYDGGTTITVFDLNRALTNFVTGDLNVSTLNAVTAVVTGNVSGGNISTVGRITASGNVAGGNITTTGSVVASGNVAGGNITTTGSVAATGAVSGLTVAGFVRPTAGSASQAPLVFTAGTNTSVPAAGAVEYNGTVFLTTPSAAQRGLMPTEYLVALSTNYIANDFATAQKVFNVPANGEITVLPNTTYFVEGQYVIAPAINFNAVSVQTLFALGSGATLTSIRYTASSTTGLVSAVNTLKQAQSAAATAVTVTDSAPGGAATNFVIQIRGIIRTNTAGTLTPQMQFTGTPGSAPVVQANSFFRLIPVGSGSVTTIGAWT
jgi:hypothetical protein